MSDLGIKQNKCSSFPRLVLGQLFSFPILVSVFLVPLQVTFILSQILWQGDSSRVTFWLPPLHASYCTSSTRCFPMCQGPQPVLVLLVPGSSWFAWSPSKVTPLPSASSFLLAAFNRASHFSEPGAESSGSPASEGRRSLIRSATRDAFTAMHDTRQEQVTKQEQVSGQELAANSSSSARRHQDEKRGENAPGVESVPEAMLVLPKMLSPSWPCPWGGQLC